MTEQHENSKDVLVRADHVKVYFKGKDKKSGTVRAVDDVSFDIFKGETFGVVGESGCGKSTLGRTLIRLINPTDGHVYLDGEDISSLRGNDLKQMRKKAQIIFQDPSACLNPRRTIRQILMEPFEIHHLTGKIDVNARIEELLHLVGLDTYHLSRYPHEMSGGQKQRIGIARALALNPQIIICDEAVSALDVSVQAQVLNLLQDLKKRLGLTYFFISHNLNVVYQVSDRVGVMYLGKMVEIATYDQLYEKRYHPIGFQAATAAAVAKWAVGINTYMFKSSAVHGDPLMNLMIGNDAAAQISVQQDDNSTVKLRMIP